MASREPVLLSCVIPLFNKADSVERAVGSFLQQSYKRKELIIVDDGSTDASYDVVKRFLSHSNVRCIRQSNQGVSVARNSGVRACGGDYVFFLDADDEWLPTHMSNIAALIVENPSAALYTCKSSKIDECGIEVLPFGRHDPVSAGRLEDFFRVYAKCSHIVNSSTACVNKRYFLHSGGFPQGWMTGEDIFLWFMLAATGDVMYSPEPTARIHLDAANRTGCRKQSRLPYHIEYFLRQGNLEVFSRDIKQQAVGALVSNALLNCAGAVLNGNRKLAFAYVPALAPHSRSRAVLSALIAASPIAVLKGARGLRRGKSDRNRLRQ